MKNIYLSVRNKMQMIFAGLFLFSSSFVMAQPIRVDLNQSGRQPAETNEPGYMPWIVTAGLSDFMEFDNGVTVTLSSAGEGTLKTNWYKAGILETQLVSDGVLVTGITATSENVIIELKISGLSAGNHTLLTYHNQVDNPATNTFAPMDVYCNGELVMAGVVPTERIDQNALATRFYDRFSVAEGEDVVFQFKAVNKAGVTNKTVIINGFEIDTSNPDEQAIIPSPVDRDEHVDADNTSIILSWTPAGNAVSHNVYVGTDIDAVTNADISSSEYKGNQIETSFPLDNLYSMDTYYWRIDEINTDGDLTKGNIWYFRPRQLAFEDAEGYGRFARGGRGGIVVKVTNLNDSGSGSLRDAIENSAYEGIPRTIIFDVAGVIKLNDRLSVNKPYITIAGQTAPGKGICVSGHAFGIGGVGDVIIRHMRLRVGTDDTTDGMGQSGSNNCIIDHSSISWSKDEATSSRNAFNITFQRTLISEPLNRAGHKNYGAGTAHGYAGSIGGDIASYHHNLLAHCYGRNWSLAGGLDGNGYYQGKLDIFNNVIYNWGRRTTDGGAQEVNFVANYYKPGIETTQFNALNAQWDGFPGYQKYYCNGNIVEGKFEDLTNPRNACTSDSSNPDPWSDTPFFPSYATVHTAKDAYKHVLSDVGATQPVFDDHDMRIIDETLDGSWTFRGSYNSPNGTRGIIDHQNDVGGWEDYGDEIRANDYDSDGDGLPDWWEAIIGTNPNSPEGDFSDSNADDDKDGFTNLDDFLEWMGRAHYTVEKQTPLEIDLQELSRGFTASPVYSIQDSENCNVSVDGHKAKVNVAASAEGLGEFTFKVTDSEGSSMSRKVGLRVISGETGMDEILLAGFDVRYVNPVKDLLSLQITSDVICNLEVSVFDVSGKYLVNENYTVASGQNEFNVDVSSLRNGVYLAKLKINGEQQIIKFVKK